MPSPPRHNGRPDRASTPVRRAADLRLRGRTGTVSVRVRWPGAAPAGPAPLIVFLPDAAPDGVDEADDVLCRDLCARAQMVVLCVPWAERRPGAPGSPLERAGLALEWCADHAGELGADPDRLVVAGRGAGAAAAGGSRCVPGIAAGRTSRASC